MQLKTLVMSSLNKLFNKKRDLKNMEMEYKEFKDKNKLAVHRLINEELKDEWENGVHSISIKTEA